MIDTPSADNVACTNNPEQIPKVVMTPSRRPPRSTLRITSMVSGPGAIVSAAAASAKAINCGSTMSGEAWVRYHFGMRHDLVFDALEVFEEQRVVPGRCVLRILARRRDDD